jgi:hypothetical protein
MTIYRWTDQYFYQLIIRHCAESDQLMKLSVRLEIVTPKPCISSHRFKEADAILKLYDV